MTVLVLMLIIRPLNIALCTASSDLNWRQKLFLSWIAPRGIVSASVASLFGILLTERGINGGEAIKALVFLTIIITVLSQGLTASLIARLLGVRDHPEGNGAVIVGCNPLSLLLARLFKESGELAVLIDTNAEACEEAERENLPVLVNSALDTEVLEEAGLNTATTFLAITNNGDVNAVIAQQAQEEFQPPRIVSVFPEETTTEETAGKKSNPKKAATGQKSSTQKIVFPNIPLKTWNGHLKEGNVRLGETVLRVQGSLMQRAHLRALMRSGELIPLLVKRENRIWVSLQEDDWQTGDRIVYLLHDPKPKLLQRLSGGSRPSRLNVETLPVVEEVPLPARVVDPLPPPPPPSESTELAPPEANGIVKIDAVLPTNNPELNGRAPATPGESSPPSTGLSNQDTNDVE